jgi:hypothetical protein
VLANAPFEENRMIGLRLAMAACLVCIGCSGAESSVGSALDEEAAPLKRAPTFVDARYYFHEPEAIDAWYALTATLRQNFDDVCGDTFCEGDYSNYESLGFRCSVDQRGVIGSCAWLFAASTDEVVPETGEVLVNWRNWRCTLPVARGTRVNDLVKRLTNAGDTPLFVSLPRTTSSLYDGLVDCL